MDFLRLIYTTYFLNFCAHSKESKRLIFSTKSDFSQVAKTAAFVDKTLMIKTILFGLETILITAPRKFGKSTNLDMLKRFLSLQSKNNGKILHIFKNLKIYENNSTFFCDNFAKHPVIYVDFKSGTTNSYEDAIDGYKRAIHNAYLEHEYLIDSQKLLDYDKTACKKWCREDSFKQLGKQAIRSGLAGLARMLKKHFSKEVMLLIDEYDSIINNALSEIESNSQFRGIVSLTSDILTTLLKSNENVQIAVVTGVSYISPPGLSAANNLEIYRFLEDHPFVNFYGLTEDEISELFHKDEFKSKSGRRDVAKKLYNGYVCKRGRHIYNTYSFLMFLKTGKAIPHWDTTKYASSISSMLDYPEMPNIIKLLLDGESINISMYDEISIRDALQLKDLYSHVNTTLKVSSNLLMSHLLELGLLTFNQTFSDTDFGDAYQEEQIQVKIPNWEVYETIFHKFKDYYIDKCNLPSSLESTTYSAFIKFLYNFWKTAKNPCKEYLGVLFTLGANNFGRLF